MSSKLKSYISHLKEGVTAIQFSSELSNGEERDKIQKEVIPTLFETIGWIESEVNLLNNKPTIYVHADKDGFVRCPFCGNLHKHGGNGNGIASGGRKPDCKECGDEEYFVVPHGMTIKYFVKPKLIPKT